MLIDLREDQLDHRSFSALLPSQRGEILRRVTERLPWHRAELITFHTNSRDHRTYVTVRLAFHRDGVDEFVTWLVAFGRQVYFDTGHYGFVEESDAVRDMFKRAL